jgi:hypothetical protein
MLATLPQASDPIKQADLDFFQEQLLRKNILQLRIQNTLPIVRPYLQYVAAALDLTNEDIPLKIEKIGDNRYSFKREIPQKIMFQSSEDAYNFYISRTSLSCYVGAPIPLTGTNITCYNIDIEPMYGVYDAIGPNVLETVGMVMTGFGIGVLLAILYSRHQFQKKVKQGFTVTITGTFETIC